MNRRLRATWSAAALAVVTMFSAACAGAPPDVGAAGDGKGTVKAMVLLNPASKIVAEKVIPEFEKAHPEIDIQWEMVPYAGGYIQKALLSLANEQAPFDVIMWWDQLLPTTEQFLEPLDPYIDQSGLDVEDFDPAWRDATHFNGHTYGIPWVADFWTFWYRRDLLEQAGVPVPTTTDELMAGCRALTDPSKKQYGYVMLGQRDPLQVMSWLPWLWANNGEIVDRDWNPQLDTSQAAAAGEYWKSLMDCAAPGSANYVHTDAITAFASGNGVMGTMGVGWIGAVQQQAPDIAAKINFGGRIPGNGDANHSAHGWPFVIAKASKNKAAAWTFVNYLARADTFRTVASDPTGSHVVMARKSVYNDPAIEAVHPWVKDVRQVVQYVRPKFNPELGNPRGWTEIMDTIALHNSEILAGEKSPEDAYRAANTTLETLMKDFGQTTG